MHSQVQYLQSVQQPYIFRNVTPKIIGLQLQTSGERVLILTHVSRIGRASDTKPSTLMQTAEESHKLIAIVIATPSKRSNQANCLRRRPCCCCLLRASETHPHRYRRRWMHRCLGREAGTISHRQCRQARGKLGIVGCWRFG